MSELTHFDEHGASRMVDTSDKAETLREARASGLVRMPPATLELIRNRALSKGDVLEVARLAAIMATKRTSDLVPLCHPVPIEGVNVELSPRDATTVQITAAVRTTARPAVEMEALTAVSVAALTAYDMRKAIDKTMSIGGIRLVSKTGGPKRR